MKKLTVVAALAIAAVGFTACGNQTPKEDLKADVDSLSYAFGVDQGQGVKKYLQQMNIDTAYINEFIKGLNDGATSMDDKKKAAYNAGVGVGMNMNMVIKNQINKSIFGEDSTQSISLSNFLAGFAASAKGNNKSMTIEKARQIEQRVPQAIQAKTAEKKYGENKKKNDAFMAKIAKTPGMKALKQGVYYKEIKAGTGAKPTASQVVKISYEGKTIEGKMFDKNDNMAMQIGQAVPGFNEALLNMPVGSKWEVYIPYAAGYGAQQPSPDIKPFSTLIFTIELLSIEKAAPEAAAASPRR